MNKTIDFLKPHLTGKRFKDHSIPLEIIKDFSALEEMIIELTKVKYLDENPDRKRVPRGFVDGITLKLQSIKEGSAIPHFTLEINQKKANLFTSEYLEKSRDSIFMGINAAEKSDNIYQYIPENLLVYFDRIGRSLHDDESIEFEVPEKNINAQLTKSIRKKLLLASPKLKEVTDEICIRGKIPEADQDKMTFKLQLENGQKIISPILLPYFDTIMEAFQGYKQNVKVLVHGIGKFNRSEKLQSIETIEHISILDSLDVSSRLDELRLLENGWLVENSVAPKNEDLDWFLENFEKNYNDELPLPYIFPTAEGNIQLEWEIDNYDISLEIDFGIHSAQWHNYDQEFDTYESDILNLEAVSGWDSLCEKLNHLLLKKADHE